jgi:hypothetical protein
VGTVDLRTFIGDEIEMMGDEGTGEVYMTIADDRLDQPIDLFVDSDSVEKILLPLAQTG